MHITDYFDEYNYNGRNFIRYKATIDQPNNIILSNNDTINKNQFYWIEVKPIMKKIYIMGLLSNSVGRQI